MTEIALAALVIILSLVFTYSNGVQDGSSVTAGLIVCRVMSPLRTVLLVAACEMIGAVFGGSAVANAMKSICRLPLNEQLLPVLAAGLTAAISWNFFAKAIKMPSSSTHALFGGLLGSFVAAPGGWGNIVFGELSFFHPSGFGRVIVSLFASVFWGFLIGFIMLNVVRLLLLRATNQVGTLLKFGQTLTVGLLAFGHGANDPQKSMGIIMMALYAAGLTTEGEIPLWARIATGLAICFGVISIVPGIVKRVGSGIFKLGILEGFVLDSASSFILVLSSLSGCPVSTSQVISSTVIGVGSGKHFKAVRWTVARDILLSWFMTIPSAALMAFLLYTFAFRFLNFLIP
ncbi:MAG: inorganic phosphate transporter [Candidatus Obscuribacterales bacterium]|nr:inorganic phosphate transporter [Candidatus Obscuribacterales bacterium]